MERRELFLALRSAPRARSGPLTVAWIPGDPAEPPRVAYAIGRRVGPAVRRNRLRRRLRALARTEADLGAGAYLVSAGPGAADLDFPSLGRHLNDAARQARSRSTHLAQPGSGR
ncbi:MAG TPA: ribonuclease P protein component [Acidimicrobiales bacterium]|nr:ribonuclease P protein component [Acidimicrobiales bacterium]